jgi:hypothetical protein
MSAELYRKYLDIINENSQPRVQLDEGMIDSLKAVAQNAIKKIAPQKVEQITNFVSKVLGKPADQITMADATIANARKLVAANQQMTEDGVGAAFGGILGTIVGIGGAAGFAGPAGNPNMALLTAAIIAIIFAVIGHFASEPMKPSTQSLPPKNNI